MIAFEVVVYYGYLRYNLLYCPEVLYQGTDSRIKEAPLLDAMGLLSLLVFFGEYKGDQMVTKFGG